MKICLVGAKMFYVDGRTHGHTDTHTHTDMKKLTVTFHNFSNMPNQITLMFQFPNTIPEELNIFYFLQ